MKWLSGGGGPIPEGDDDLLLLLVKVVEQHGAGASGDGLVSSMEATRVRGGYCHEEGGKQKWNQTAACLMAEWACLQWKK